MQRSHGRTGRPWLRLCAVVYAEETHCWLCKRWVNPALASPHPMSRSVDHLVMLSHDGPPRDRGNVRLAHRRCNTVRGNQLRHVTPDQCACTTGQPCAKVPTTRPTTERVEVMIDLRSI